MIVHTNIEKCTIFYPIMHGPQICTINKRLVLLLAMASSNLVGRKSKCYFIIKFSLLISIRLCWKEIRPETGKTIKNEFVASFL